ncbi:hypothetical protein DdX_18253 [Ditylenchus destructor]|uniref:Uncharacterized protein n=1 Tax=Ditylenchus destructor TaxID=166010 RepID=A0AAD4MK88_9BILA|nr:hypothetical protein DdX_18253 [Ditylenchus destructor]
MESITYLGRDYETSIYSGGDSRIVQPRESNPSSLCMPVVPILSITYCETNKTGLELKKGLPAEYQEDKV